MASELRSPVAAESIRPLGFRIPITCALGAIFAAVIGIQSLVFRDLSRRMMDEVVTYPGMLVPGRAVPWAQGTALAHWGVLSEVIFLQGPAPRKLMLDEHCGIKCVYEDPPRIPFAYIDGNADAKDPAPGSSGWFDFRPLLRDLARQPQAPPQ